MNDVTIRNQPLHVVASVTEVSRPKSSNLETPVEPVHAVDDVAVVHQKTEQADEAGEELPADGKQVAAGKADNAGELERAVADIKDYFQSVQRDLSFDVDRDSGRTLIKVTDTKTGELIRQFPSETVLKLAEALKTNQDTDSLKGLLFSGQA